MNSRKYLFRSIFLSIIAVYIVIQLSNISKPSNVSVVDSALEEAIKNCKENFKITYGKTYDSIIDANIYCECVLTKFRNSTPEELEKSAQAMTDPNSTTFNEILLPCTQDAFIYKKESKQIFGLVERDTVKVIHTTLGLKIKVKVGKTQYYFILDSGASELFISSKMYQEYIRDNPKTIISKLPSRTFQMANGTTELCQRVQLDKVFIGKFIIPNVVFAITPLDCTPLLGQDVLSRFSSWSVIENNTKVVFVR